MISHDLLCLIVYNNIDISFMMSCLGFHLSSFTGKTHQSESVKKRLSPSFVWFNYQCV